MGKKNLQVDPSVAMGMHWLQSVAQWNILIMRPYTLCNSHILLTLDHCLCIRIKFYWITILEHLIYYVVMKHISIHKHHIFHLRWFNKLFKHKVYGRNGTMIVYDHYTTLTSHETFTTLGVKYKLQHSIEIQGNLFVSLL